jgi:SAM-dependent methyltransferase
VTEVATVASSYFHGMYDRSDDPWSLETRWYEQRKHAISVAQLPEVRYSHGFEPGCSIGVLTAQLAPRCDNLLSCDLVPAAVQAAARRMAGYPHVAIRQAAIPAQWPAGRFDLIVLSEMLYYFNDADLREVLDKATGALEPEGTLLAVHWRHPVREHARSGDDVHDVLGRQPGLARLVCHRELDFLAEVFIRTDSEPQSVAQATGLA